jgi:hypothetical protein
MTGNQLKARTWHQHIKGHHANRQNIMVINSLAKMTQPCTIRILHKVMNAHGYAIDLVSLRRAITNLTKPDKNGHWLNMWNKQIVHVVHERPCPITSKTVGWYELVPVKDQLSLFAAP